MNVFGTIAIVHITCSTDRGEQESLTLTYPTHLPHTQIYDLNRTRALTLTLTTTLTLLLLCPRKCCMTLIVLAQV